MAESVIVWLPRVGPKRPCSLHLVLGNTVLQALSCHLRSLPYGHHGRCPSGQSQLNPAFQPSPLTCGRNHLGSSRLAHLPTECYLMASAIATWNRSITQLCLAQIPVPQNVTPQKTVLNDPWKNKSTTLSNALLKKLVLETSWEMVCWPSWKLFKGNHHRAHILPHSADFNACLAQSTKLWTNILILISIA